MRSSEPLRPVYDFELGDLERERSARGEICRAILPGSRVLDVGCDTGRFGAILRARRGADVDGIERDPVAAEHARARLVEVFERSLDDPEAFAGLGPYDTVLFLDVLEHLFDPWSVLRSAVGVLRRGGVVHAIVPNVAHVSVVRRLIQGRFEYSDVGTMDRTHVRWFTRESLRQCFTQAGLSRVHVDAVPLVPHVDAGTVWGERVGRLLTAALPNAFGGSLHARGYAPTSE
jgi:2-polyprenyl-3-methyl-5-hydroxy-6-metoxy-1,4-benzoquinol methylase